MQKIIDTILKEAKKAYKKGEVPVGCAIIKNNKIIAKAHNKKEQTNKCFNHAEVLAISKAERKLHDWRLDDCILYVTLKPCDMCMNVIKQARIGNVYYLLESNFNNENNGKLIVNKLENCNEEEKKYQEELISFFKDKR